MRRVAWQSMRLTPQPYQPPEFASSVAAYAPSHRIKLAVSPTPIQEWRLPSLPHNVQTYIKRDDMNGAAAAGNKVRKLEFLLADAINKNCNTVVTGGGIQSNHARATAILCTQLGLSCHVLLRAPQSIIIDPQKLGSDGNLLLHKMAGSHIHITSVGAGLQSKIDSLAEKLAADDPAVRPYSICIGGSDPIGVWGYIECFNELLNLGLLLRELSVTDIVMAVGSGGTASGIAIGNYLAGSPVNIHAVGVCDSEAYFYDHVDSMLLALGLRENARNIINIVDAKGRGYARNTEEELQFCLDISRRTGIVLDRVYSGKAAKWMYDETQKSEGGVFSGRNSKILFIHTGGLFGMFDRVIEPLFENDVVQVWG